MGVQLVRVDEAPPCEDLRATMPATVVGLHLREPLKVIHVREDERRELTYHPGQLTLVPAGMFSACTTTGPSSFVHLHIQPDFVARMDAEPRQLDNRFVFQDGRIEHTLLQLTQTVQSGSPDLTLQLESAAIFVWTRLLSKAPPRDRVGLSPRSFQRVRELLNERLRLGVSLSELAVVAGVSPRHFARLFQRTTSKSPQRYLAELRVQRAKELLLDPRLRILDVALEVGYENPSHFARNFARATGLTPQMYRVRAEIPDPASSTSDAVFDRTAH